MTSYNTYPILPSDPSIWAQGPPPEAPPQTGSMERGPRGTYHLNVVQAKRQGLIAKEKCLRRNTRSTIKY